jgi:hypothetical protein
MGAKETQHSNIPLFQLGREAEIDLNYTLEVSGIALA